ncbi:hypothetical protein [Dokdonia sp. 4H-3-7-5]|uniref:hypothetical protein n=1 Tax=Dokdonia sp. (strain 4H-3-7-5) TaxID=983548 RepID=UPI00020A6FA3|nr:hypothetical protein [Dokdonia sp. 4H-3-7-5]AEE20261.1 hypothetical protein Krodi_2283 [Dokdonia sp. 4H-3-7-5]
MVDELEMLKKDWQKQEGSLPKYTKADLYPMLLKKSSSVVKWILFISIAEFAVWILLSFGIKISGDDASNVKTVIGDSVEYISTGIHLAALIFFIGWFYKNYKKIENTDSPRVLMQNILNTRKTVKYYIWFNLAFLVLGTVGAFVLIEATHPEFLSTDSLFLAVISLIIMLALAIGILLIIYRLLYGRLLRRLKANYNQLKKLEL